MKSSTLMQISLLFSPNDVINYPKLPIIVKLGFRSSPDKLQKTQLEISWDLESVLMIAMQVTYSPTRKLLKSKVTDILIKKKSCETSQLWSWPSPPPKSCETSFFLFLTPWPENHYVQNKKISPLKTQKTFKKVNI